MGLFGDTTFTDRFLGHLKAGFRKEGIFAGHRYAKERAAKRARRYEEAAITLSVQAQLRRWSEQLGGDRASQGLKVVFNSSKGWTDIYFGGTGSPDAQGHGHIRVSLDGTEMVVREPYIPGQPLARREATLKDDRTPDRRVYE